MGIIQFLSTVNKFFEKTKANKVMLVLFDFSALFLSLCPEPFYSEGRHKSLKAVTNITVSIFKNVLYLKTAGHSGFKQMLLTQEVMHLLATIFYFQPQNNNTSDAEIFRADGGWVPKINFLTHQPKGLVMK